MEADEIDNICFEQNSEEKIDKNEEKDHDQKGEDSNSSSSSSSHQNDNDKGSMIDDDENLLSCVQVQLEEDFGPSNTSGSGDKEINSSDPFFEHHNMSSDEPASSSSKVSSRKHGGNRRKSKMPVKIQKVKIAPILPPESPEYNPPRRRPRKKLRPTKTKSKSNREVIKRNTHTKLKIVTTKSTRSKSTRSSKVKETPAPSTSSDDLILQLAERIKAACQDTKSGGRKALVRRSELDSGDIIACLADQIKEACSQRGTNETVPEKETKSSQKETKSSRKERSKHREAKEKAKQLKEIEKQKEIEEAAKFDIPEEPVFPDDEEEEEPEQEEESDKDKDYKPEEEDETTSEKKKRKYVRRKPLTPRKPGSVRKKKEQDTESVPGVTEKCAVCGKEFRHASKLQRHLRVHSLERPYECEYCGRKFSQMAMKIVHLRVHTGEKPFQCEHCGKQFAQKGSLQGHAVIHTNERPYECEKCGKRFVHRQSFKRHVHKTHTGEKAFQCELCGTRFAFCHALKRHLRNHSGIKAYACEVCGKAFAENYNLMVHMRIHTGEKPYICTICEKSFNQHNTLRAHMRIHQRDGTVKADPNAPPQPQRRISKGSKRVALIPNNGLIQGHHHLPSNHQPRQNMVQLPPPHQVQNEGPKNLMQQADNLTNKNPMMPPNDGLNQGLNLVPRECLAGLMMPRDTFGSNTITNPRDGFVPNAGFAAFAAGLMPGSW